MEIIHGKTLQENTEVVEESVSRQSVVENNNKEVEAYPPPEDILQELTRLRSLDPDDPFTFNNLTAKVKETEPVTSYLELAAYIKGKSLRTTSVQNLAVRESDTRRNLLKCSYCIKSFIYPNRFYAHLQTHEQAIRKESLQLTTTPIVLLQDVLKSRIVDRENKKLRYVYVTVPGEKKTRKIYYSSNNECKICRRTIANLSEHNIRFHTQALKCQSCHQICYTKGGATVHAMNVHQMNRKSWERIFKRIDSKCLPYTQHLTRQCLLCGQHIGGLFWITRHLQSVHNVKSTNFIKYAKPLNINERNVSLNDSKLSVKKRKKKVKNISIKKANMNP